jgi:hypothetical protein
MGVLEGTAKLSSLILFQCICDNTLSIPWDLAPDVVKKKARKVKLAPPLAQRNNFSEEV